jgi:hypothetical protein
MDPKIGPLYYEFSIVLSTDLIEMQCVIVPNKYSCAITNSGSHCWSRRKLNRTDGAQQQKKTATIAENFISFILFYSFDFS